MKQELLNNLKEILEVDEIHETDTLESFDEWDSLTSLSIIAMVDTNYNITLSAEQIKKFITVKDIVDFARNQTT
jgi:acyl carrier protein